MEGENGENQLTSLASQGDSNILAFPGIPNPRKTQEFTQQNT